MAAIYFIAGLIAGMAIAWYLTKQHYDAGTISLEEHKRLMEQSQVGDSGPPEDHAGTEEN